MSFLQHILGIISCHLHNSLWSELYDLVLQMSPCSSGSERHMQRKDTRSRGVRPGLFSPKLALWSGSYLIGTTGCVHQGQCVVFCLSSLWSTGTKAKCGYHGSGCCVRGSPPPVLRDSVLMSQVTVPRSAHSTKRQSPWGTCVQTPGTHPLPSQREQR